MNSLDSVLRKYIISASQLNEQNIYLESQSEEFLNRLYDNSLDYPAIILSQNSDYYAEHNQDDVDLENEIRASVLIDIEIVCNNIDDIIHFESRLNWLISETKTNLQLSICKLPLILKLKENNSAPYIGQLLHSNNSVAYFTSADIRPKNVKTINGNNYGYCNRRNMCISN